MEMQDLVGRGDLLIEDVKGVLLEAQPAWLRQGCIGCLTYYFGIPLGVIFQTIHQCLGVVVLQIVTVHSGGRPSSLTSLAHGTNGQKTS